MYYWTLNVTVMLTNVRSFLPLSLFLGSLLTVFGSEETVATEPVYKLQDYVVVATRTPLSLDRVSPSVSYVSSKEMEFWQDTQLTDVLQRESGMTVIQSGAKGGQTSLFNRGTESNHTAFFIDGRRLNSGFGNQFDLENLQVSGLQSVQVLKGAASVQYGSSNIGGVIDLRTRSGFYSNGLEGSVQGEIGSNDSIAGGLGLSYGEDNWAIRVNANSQTTDNERENDQYEAHNQLHRAEIRVSDRLQLEWLSFFTKTDKGLIGSRFSPKLEDKQETTSWMISPGLRWSTDRCQVHAFYARSLHDLESLNLRGSYDANYNFRGTHPAMGEIEVETDELNLQVDFESSEGLLLTTGLLYRKDDAKNNNVTYDPLEPVVAYANGFEQFGIFGQAIWEATDLLELRGGTRYDSFSDFDEKMTSSVEVIYNLGDTGCSLFAKLGTAYAPPAAIDIAYDNAAAETPLQPEESVSYEVGLRQVALEQRLSHSWVFFRNEIDQLLIYDNLTKDSFNEESAKTQGFEYQLDYALDSQTDLFFGYTYLHAFGEDRLLRRPRHTLYFSARYRPVKNLSLGITGYGHIDRKDTDPETFAVAQADDYFVANFVADWAVTEQWSLYARVENLFDKFYEPAAGYPALGQAGYLGARYRF